MRIFMNKSETDSTKMSILGYCGWKYSLARPENHFKTNKSRFNKHHYPLKMIDSCWNGHPPSKNAFESINLKDFLFSWSSSSKTRWQWSQRFHFKFKNHFFNVCSDFKIELSESYNDCSYQYKFQSRQNLILLSVNLWGHPRFGPFWVLKLYLRNH